MKSKNPIINSRVAANANVYDLHQQAKETIRAIIASASEEVRLQSTTLAIRRHYFDNQAKKYASAKDAEKIFALFRAAEAKLDAISKDLNRYKV